VPDAVRQCLWTSPATCKWQVADWFLTPPPLHRPIGTNTGYLTAKLPIPVAPTHKVVELPPQTSSLSFNEQGQIIDFTMG
jgi:hypothetical protein